MIPRILLAAAAVAVLALTGPALANNAKAYSGSYCHPYNGSQADQFLHTVSGIQNLSTSASGWITCPVLHDETDTYTGTFWIWLHWSGSGNMSCTFYSKNFNGSTRQTQHHAGGQGWFTIPNITSDDSIGAYALLCRLPPRGILNTVFVNERS